MNPTTQIDAWLDLQGTITGKRADVLRIITFHSGLALFEVSDRLGWPVNRVSGRITELRKLGLIEDTGERRVNPESGKGAIVWRAI